MKIKRLLENKLGRDIAWTMGSFSVLAISGIVINLAVALFRDAADLGIFNLTYAIYIIAAQIAVCGVHYSVLRHAAYYSDDQELRNRLLSTAVVMAFLAGIAAAGLVYLLSPYLGELFSSQRSALSIMYSSAGLVLFPVNKVLLSYLNGLRSMKAFSFLQASRYTVVMVWVTLLSASRVEFEWAALCFLVAELVTALAALGFLFQARLWTRLDVSLTWVKKHLAFGSKGFLSGMFVEINSRVDVLLIGVFMSEQAVGIYSFAAMLIDGLYHVLAMIRINFNPILVSASRDGDWDGARNLLKKSKLYGYPITLAMSLCVLLAFTVMTEFFVSGKGLQEGLYPLLILLGGLTLISAFIPFDNMLMVSGFPGYQTLQHLAVIVVNIGLNICLVPLFGLEGAAMATVSGYFVGIAALILLIRQKLHWNIWKNSLAG